MILSEQAHLPVTALTHPGMTGKNNEDRFGISAFFLPGGKQPTPVLLAVLSDGIGGHRAGEVASELTVNLISQTVAQSDGSQPTQTLAKAIETASIEIQRQASENSERHGMGATCACALIIANRLYTATVGDSRIYLMRNHTIRQLSIDHTWIQEAIEAGILQPDQISGHPNAHVIRRYLGSPKPPEVDFRINLTGHESEEQAIANQGMRLRGGDRLLLCSDGLTDLVKENEILAAYENAALSASKDAQQAATQSLIDLACERGGHDNITITVIEFPPEMVVERSRQLPWRAIAIGCAALLLVAALAGALIAGWFWFNDGGAGATPTPAASQDQLLPWDSSATPQQDGTPAQAPSLASAPLPVAGTATHAPFAPGGPTPTPWPTHTRAPSQTVTSLPKETATSTPTLQP